MIQIAAILYGIIIIGVIAFQCALIAGKPWGHLTQGGRYDASLPAAGRAAAVVSIFVLIVMAAGITSAAYLPPNLPVWTGWVALGLQILSTVLNWITPSRPERKLWGPVTTFMLVLASYVVLAG